MIARVATWWTIFKICVEERLVYRGDFALGTLMRFLPIVTQIFLWTAVFASAGTGNIQGFTREDVVAYYLTRCRAGVFEHATGIGHARKSRGRDQEVYDPADRSDQLLPLSRRTRLCITDRGRLRCALSVPELPWLATRRSVRGICALDVVPVGLYGRTME
jgi:ABC-2 type transport system permease protein